MLFSKALFIWTVTTAVSDGSSASVAPSAAVHCLLTPFGIWTAIANGVILPGAIEGYCDNIHKGKIRVGINIGNCHEYGNSNGETGWKSVSRLIIEEVPRSQ